VARCGYHGWHDWCLPRERFVPSGLDEQIAEFDANSPVTLRAIFERHPRQIAAVILAPEMVLPHDPAVIRNLVALTHAQGALFIMDEVKTGLRIAPNSVSERAGVVPDILTVSKALGNGWPVAALLGRRDVLASGSGMHYSATYHGDVAAMAAALATVAIIREHGVQRHVERLGQMLIDGLNQGARELGLPAEAYGEPLPAMPFFRFTHPLPAVNQALTDTFFRTVLAEGLLLHPRHMWFLSLAHTPADVEQTLAGAFRGMREAARVLDSKPALRP
jgi:glutamate-1-semialdehyde 2,1-aminomutase